MELIRNVDNLQLMLPHKLICEIPDEVKHYASIIDYLNKYVLKDTTIHLKQVERLGRHFLQDILPTQKHAQNLKGKLQKENYYGKKKALTIYHDEYEEIERIVKVEQQENQQDEALMVHTEYDKLQMEDIIKEKNELKKQSEERETENQKLLRENAHLSKQCRLLQEKVKNLDKGNKRKSEINTCRLTGDTYSPSEEKSLQFLCLMDKFKVSEEAFHELSMVCEHLPRLSDITNIQFHVAKEIPEVHKTYKYPGARISIIDYLEMEMKHLPYESKHIHLLIDSDVVRVSRQVCWTTLSITFLKSEEQRTLPVCVVKGEDYHTLRIAMKDTWDELNKIILDGHIELLVAGELQKIKTEITISSSLKFLKTVFGMKDSTSDSEQPCLFCKMPKSDIYKLPKTLGHFHSQKRTMDGILKDCQQMANSCIYPPLLRIPMENVVISEPQMFLNIMEHLMKNIVSEVSRNSDDKKSKKGNIEMLTKLIADCGVHVEISNTSSEHDFMFLNRHEKEKILKHLPDKLENCESLLIPCSMQNVLKLWKDFDEFNELLHLFKPGDEVTLWKKGVNWLCSYKNIASIFSNWGYRCSTITSHMHIMVAHIPQMCEHFGGILQLTSQRMEKLNDELKRIDQGNACIWYALKDILLVCHRKHYMRLINFGEHKQEEEYVEKDATEEWKGHEWEMDAQLNNDDVQKLSAAELRLLLLDQFGISTATKNKRALLETFEKNKRKKEMEEI